MLIAFAGQKGGVGKSTLSMAVACEFLVRGRRTLLVDGDYEQGTVRVFANIAAEKGHEAPVVVAMGKNMYRPDQLPALAQAYDVTVIDCPPRYAEVQRAALMVADVVVLPVGPNPADLWALANTAELVEQALAVRPELRAGVLINRKDTRTVLGRKVRTTAIASELHVFAVEVSNRVALAEAPAAGLGVTVYAPNDQASTQIRALVDELAALGNMYTQERSAANG